MKELWLSNEGYFLIVEKDSLELIDDIEHVKLDLPRPRGYRSTLTILGYKRLEVLK